MKGPAYCRPFYVTVSGAGDSQNVKLTKRLEWNPGAFFDGALRKHHIISARPVYISPTK